MLFLGGAFQAFSTSILTTLGVITPTPAQQFVTGIFILLCGVVEFIIKEKRGRK